MARYTGPVCKLARREGVDLMLKSGNSGRKVLERRGSQPPGQHGASVRRRQLSDYGVQLREKQKVRRIYGVLERQFRRYYGIATRTTGQTGAVLLQILERRLDNVVFRLGYAVTRAQARQLVNHGHITVNGRKTDIPSALVEVGDVIGVRAESRKRDYFKDLEETKQLNRVSPPSWLSLDAGKLEGVVQTFPSREELDMSINEQLIVEFYSR
ncbi:MULTISPECIES: 30S ribosomal protein S4 [Herpetosiphon]|uniref:Small ribosomal subunit protein uS4 n=1 Tax=Herpetosiphon geysericola TaxID=70996 RepID=A0A0P6YQZ1_9CHLR|nr:MULTISPECIES: 30S ribosomal protein S4 [Herpetosiphon]KPL85552.1 30S ribosomal protein S4 [Herpetosiphon geysericola]MBM7841447.1 small subunit ribosomal protein S4 [Herpetosiphon giganteus]